MAPLPGSASSFLRKTVGWLGPRGGVLTRRWRPFFECRRIRHHRFSFVAVTDTRRSIIACAQPLGLFVQAPIRGFGRRLSRIVCHAVGGGDWEKPLKEGVVSLFKVSLSCSDLRRAAGRLRKREGHAVAIDATISQIVSEFYSRSKIVFVWPVGMTIKWAALAISIVCCEECGRPSRM